MVPKGAFRKDLYYRLSTFPIPCRRCASARDIPLLANRCWHACGPDGAGCTCRPALARLAAYPISRATCANCAMCWSAHMTKFVFVTGGVVSSLGKGIAAASLAAILESRGLKVTLIKLDPYLNVDPGTMSPFQHGEVFVTDDGAETDLDLGHYERFITTSG
jgi:hypothetical protein